MTFIKKISALGKQKQIINTVKMKKILKISVCLFILSFALNSCNYSKTDKVQHNKNISKNEYLMMSVLYQQKSAEYRALSYQAYNIAKIRLDEYLKTRNDSLKPAVVVDIDETVLDNSPWEAKCILENINYPKQWNEWCKSAKAKPLPGAVDFLNYAFSKNVDVFYISNRKENLKEATIQNLKTSGFPQVDKEHIFTMRSSENKKERRALVTKNHHIILLIGDNLSDFSEIFEKKSIKKRFAITDSLKREFGNRFIILPNAMYGEWENAIYDYNRISDKEKLLIRIKNLESF